MNHPIKWGCTAPLACKSLSVAASAAPLAAFKAHPTLSTLEQWNDQAPYGAHNISAAETLIHPALPSPPNAARTSSHACPNEYKKDKTNFSSPTFVFSLSSIFAEKSGRLNEKRVLVPSKRSGKKERQRISAAHRDKLVGKSAITSYFGGFGASAGARERYIGCSTLRKPCPKRISKSPTATPISSQLCCGQDVSKISRKNVVSGEKNFIDDLSVHCFSFETVSSWELSSPRLSSASLGSDKIRTPSSSLPCVDGLPCITTQTTPASSFPYPRPGWATLGEKHGAGVGVQIRNHTGVEHVGEVMPYSLNTRMELLRLANPYSYAHFQPKCGVDVSGRNASQASMGSAALNKDRVDTNAERHPSTSPLISASLNQITTILPPPEKDFGILVASQDSANEKCFEAAGLEATGHLLCSTRVSPIFNASMAFIAENQHYEDQKSQVTGPSGRVLPIRCQLLTKQAPKQMLRKGFSLKSTRIAHKYQDNSRERGPSEFLATAPEFIDILAPLHSMNNPQCKPRSTMLKYTKHCIDAGVLVTGEQEIVFDQRSQQIPHQDRKAVKVIRTATLGSQGHGVNPLGHSRGLHVGAVVEPLDTLQWVWEAAKDVEDII